jgi:hypothetical protein
MPALPSQGTQSQVASETTYVNVRAAFRAERGKVLLR